jgi:hypothetical protein
MLVIHHCETFVSCASHPETDRQAAIKTIASETESFSNEEMLEGGGFTFGQEAYVGTARATG